MATYSVSDLAEADIPTAIRIAAETGLSPWSAEGLRSHLTEPDNFAVKTLNRAGKTAGFLIARAVPGESEVEVVTELLNIGVRPGDQGTGAGRLMIERLITWSRSLEAARIWLEVRDSNKQAIGFYLKLGFEVAGRRRGFYSDPPEDALVMKLELER